MNTPETCYAITSGQYSDYTVCAIFTTKEAAEAALPAYRDCEDDNWWRIEEFPLNPSVPFPPTGQFAFEVCRFNSEPSTLQCDRCSALEVSECGPLQVYHTGLEAYMFARDEDHAIKIASERFAQYDAQQAGIA